MIEFLLLIGFFHLFIIIWFASYIIDLKRNNEIFVKSLKEIQTYPCINEDIARIHNIAQDALRGTL